MPQNTFSVKNAARQESLNLQECSSVKHRNSVIKSCVLDEEDLKCSKQNETNDTVCLRNANVESVHLLHKRANIVKKTLFVLLTAFALAMFAWASEICVSKLVLLFIFIE